MGDRLDYGSDLLLELDGRPISGMLRELDLAYSGTPMEHILPLMLIADVFGDGKGVEESLSDMVKMTRCVFRKIRRTWTPKRRKTTCKTIRRDCAKRNRHK